MYLYLNIVADQAQPHGNGKGGSLHPAAHAPGCPYDLNGNDQATIPLVHF